MKDTTPHLLPIFALISLAFPLHTFPIQFHPFPPQPLINSFTNIIIPSFLLSSPTLFFTLNNHFPTHQTSTRLLIYLSSQLTPPLFTPLPCSGWLSMSFTSSSRTLPHPPPQPLLPYALTTLHTSYLTCLISCTHISLHPHTPLILPPLRTHLSTNSLLTFLLLLLAPATHLF